MAFLCRSVNAEVTITSKRIVGRRWSPTPMLATAPTQRDGNAFARATRDVHLLPSAGRESACWLPTWLPAGPYPSRDPRSAPQQCVDLREHQIMLTRHKA